MLTQKVTRNEAFMNDRNLKTLVFSETVLSLPAIDILSDSIPYSALIPFSEVLIDLQATYRGF